MLKMKNNMRKFVPLVLSALSLLAAGCAQDNTLNTGEKAKEYLELYMQKYYPYVTPNEYGLFVLEDTPGSGSVWSPDYAYTYASTTIRSLGGTITSTTEERFAQQLGTYVRGNYYGPKFQLMGENASMAGVDRLFEGMRVGGKRKAVIPAWLLTTSRYNTEKEYIDACSSDASLVYTVSLEGLTNDVTQTEKDSLASYVHRVYGTGVQPVSYNSDEPDGSFYFISDSTAFIGTQKFPADTTIRINYTGRLLNGQVFDTTLEKVAKDEGLYSSSKTYGPASLTVSTNYTEFKLNDNSVIDGFQNGLKKMRWLGQKAHILFISNLGYTSTGSGQTIPPYSPLLFEIELL